MRSSPYVISALTEALGAALVVAPSTLACGDTAPPGIENRDGFVGPDCSEAGQINWLTGVEPATPVDYTEPPT